MSPYVPPQFEVPAELFDYCRRHRLNTSVLGRACGVAPSLFSSVWHGKKRLPRRHRRALRGLGIPAKLLDQAINTPRLPNLTQA